MYKRLYGEYRQHARSIHFSREMKTIKKESTVYTRNGKQSNTGEECLPTGSSVHLT